VLGESNSSFARNLAVKGKQGDRWETVEFRNPMVSKVIKELAPNNALSQK
jgi:hypothetical protein